MATDKENGLRQLTADAGVKALKHVLEIGATIDPGTIFNNTVEVSVTIHNKAGNPIKATIKREVE